MISVETLILARKYTEKYVKEHGGGGGGGDGKEYVKYDTTAAWNARSSLTAERGILYVYSDHESYVDPNTGNTVYVPGIKVGDGTSLLSALPFINVLEAYFPAGGDIGDVIMKTEEGAAWVSPADGAGDDEHRLVTVAVMNNAIDDAIGDINDALDGI